MNPSHRKDIGLFDRFLTPFHPLALAALLLAPLEALHAVEVRGLRCEYRENPLGIDVPQPRLSWVIESARRGEGQTACQVLVASTPDLLAKDQGDLWDSAKVVSEQSIQVEYAGKPLESRLHCYWKVRIWDQDGKAAGWSKPAKWSMGLLKPDDWQAKWIKPDVAVPSQHGLDHCSWIWFPQTAGFDRTPPGATFFRSRLQLPTDAVVRRAFVVMCADNAFELFVNGKEALKGDDWKLPQKTEITGLLKAGENILAVAANNADIGPNWAGLIGRVTCELADGRQVALETGPAWKTWNREHTGWQEAAFDDAGWPAAQEVAKFGAAPWGQLTSQENASSPWLRKVFTLAAAPELALAYVNVMGYYELYVNGRKVGDDVLSPAVSDHARRSFYKTYDIRKLLRPGPNCVGLWLSSGWYRPGPIARVQLDFSVAGQPVRLGTDRTWTCAPSTRTLLGSWKWGDMGGERIDARRDIPRWNEVKCTTGEWIPVTEVASPQAAAAAQLCPPNRIGAVLPLAACTALGSNVWELDFGANLTGWLRLRMPRLEAGQRVVMHYADKRYQTPAGDDTPAGKISPTSQQTFSAPGGPISYQTFNQIDEFISAGKPGELFCSKFNYHGFRYVIMEGLPAKPVLGDAEALLVESDLEPAGEFACSNDLFNRIHQVNLWTLRCLDLGGCMVDCPHRERLGYGDGQVGIESLTMNRNTAAFYGKWAEDWLEAQNPATGEIPYTAPKYCDSGGGPGWGGAGCVLPWKLYLCYGDRRLLARAYEPMRRYTEFLEQKCTNNILRHYGGDWDSIGDWVAPGRGMDTSNWPPKPAAALFNNCYRLYLWDQLARAATALGRDDEAQRCRARISELRPFIHAAFYNAPGELYVLDEQSYQLMPLLTGVVPGELRGTILRKLEEAILVKRNGHLDTGMLGTYFLIQYLQETGRNDLLYAIFNQNSYPGWGYMLSQGATTLWEQWNGYWSQIHSCFTSPGGWFYQGLAGIRPDETAPGFKKIVIKPAVVGDLEWVKCGYDSIHGRIVSNWKKKGDKLTMEVTIPANTTAVVYVPAKDAAGVSEFGKSASNAECIKFLRMENGAAVYAVGSGTYRFQSTLPEAIK
jgi:alpha-L-rhamnosidase